MYFRTYSYAVLVGGSNGDGAWRGLVAIVELIDPHPYIFQSAVYGRLIYTVIYVSDRLLTQADPDVYLPPPSELRRWSPRRYRAVEVALSSHAARGLGFWG